MIRFVITAVLYVLLFVSCIQHPTQSEDVIVLPFVEEFADSSSFQKNWRVVGGNWIIENGTLLTYGSKNSPVFLNKKLPPNIRIQFDSTAESPDMDMKCEVFTDGKKHESGYILILGGWKNKLSIIARLDEHGNDRLTKKSDLKPFTVYHNTIERIGGTIQWFVNGNMYLQYTDPNPLNGKGHEYFAFNNWDSIVRYDNLKIEAIESFSK